MIKLRYAYVWHTSSCNELSRVWKFSTNSLTSLVSSFLTNGLKVVVFFTNSCFNIGSTVKTSLSKFSNRAEMIFGKFGVRISLVKTGLPLMLMMIEFKAKTAFWNTTVVTEVW